MAIVGLSIYTGTQNDLFLTWNNFKLILLASVPLGILAIGQTFLLIGGNLDLSVGSMVSMSSVMVALLIREYSMNEVLILVIVLGAGAVIGLIYGLIVALIRVPSFILTLGGLRVPPPVDRSPRLGGSHVNYGKAACWAGVAAGPVAKIVHG